MKASEMKRLLGDVSTADEIIAKGIADGSLENDLGTEPIVKSDVVTALAAQVKAEIDRLTLVKSEAPAREDAKAERLKKSQAAENAPEVVAAIHDISGVMTDIEKSTTETLSTIAKGTAKNLEVADVLLKGFAELSTRFVSLQEKVETLSKAAETSITAPKGVGADPAAAADASTAIPAPSPFEDTPAGVTDVEEFVKSAGEALTTVQIAIDALPASELQSKRAQTLRKAATQLTFGHPDPIGLVKSLGLK